MIIGGLFWSLTYILIIRRGIKDRTYGMPLAALCANISWEGIFSFIHPHSPPQLYINYIWFLLDVIIVFQFLKYGKSEFPALSGKKFHTMFLLALVTGFGLVLSVTYEFNDWQGAYAAFGQNLMMSVMFIVMLFGRGDLRGQSEVVGYNRSEMPTRGIGWAKCFVTISNITALLTGLTAYKVGRYDLIRAPSAFRKLSV